MKSAIAKLAIVCATCALAACGSTVTHSETIPTSFGEIKFAITSSGGALGDETYELSRSEVVFFRGANFAEFDAQELNGKINLQFCEGYVDEAQPILVGEGENQKLVRLTLDWTCKDKTREIE